MPYAYGIYLLTTVLHLKNGRKTNFKETTNNFDQFYFMSLLFK